MNQRNTPGVGAVLQSHGLEGLPEAHCYLRSGQRRIDVTRETEPQPFEQITHFLYEEEITPDQIGEYKVSVHRRFLKQWVEHSNRIGHSPDDLWHIREECIAALERS
jgi:hypothetical protein